MKINKIYNQNCLETMKQMDDGFIDLVVTSPPYDDLRTYKGYEFPFEEIARELYRVIKPGGVVVWVVGDQTINGSETGTSFKQALFFKEVGFNIHDTMIYEKAGCSLPDSNRYLNCFEYMFVFSKGKPNTVNFIEDRKNRFPERWGKRPGVRAKDGKVSKHRKQKPKSKEFGRRYNIWKYIQGGGYVSEDKIAYEHPAIFPEKLAADHIYTWTNPGDLVYDPFGGSGTTAKMSHRYKRNWILSEISDEYVKIAEKRLEPYITQFDIWD